jgi:hypothetical protein
MFYNKREVKIMTPKRKVIPKHIKKLMGQINANAPSETEATQIQTYLSTLLNRLTKTNKHELGETPGRYYEKIRSRNMSPVTFREILIFIEHLHNIIEERQHNVSPTIKLEEYVEAYRILQKTMEKFPGEYAARLYRDKMPEIEKGLEDTALFFPDFRKARREIDSRVSRMGVDPQKTRDKLIEYILLDNKFRINIRNEKEGKLGDSIHEFFKETVNDPILRSLFAHRYRDSIRNHFKKYLNETIENIKKMYSFNEVIKIENEFEEKYRKEDFFKAMEFLQEKIENKIKRKIVEKLPQRTEEERLFEKQAKIKLGQALENLSPSQIIEITRFIENAKLGKKKLEDALSEIEEKILNEMLRYEKGEHLKELSLQEKINEYVKTLSYKELMIKLHEEIKDADPNGIGERKLLIDLFNRLMGVAEKLKTLRKLEIDLSEENIWKEFMQTIPKDLNLYEFSILSNMAQGISKTQNIPLDAIAGRASKVMSVGKKGSQGIKLNIGRKQIKDSLPLLIKKRYLEYYGSKRFRNALRFTQKGINLFLKARK